MWPPYAPLVGHFGLLIEASAEGGEASVCSMWSTNRWASCYRKKTCQWRVRHLCSLCVAQFIRVQQLLGWWWNLFLHNAQLSLIDCFSIFKQVVYFLTVFQFFNVSSERKKKLSEAGSCSSWIKLRCHNLPLMVIIIMTEDKFSLTLTLWINFPSVETQWGSNTRKPIQYYDEHKWHNRAWWCEPSIRTYIEFWLFIIFLEV